MRGWRGWRSIYKHFFYIIILFGNATLEPASLNSLDSKALHNEQIASVLTVGKVIADVVRGG